MDFQGHVLRQPRQAASNSEGSSEPVVSVLRDVRYVPGFPAPNPGVMDLFGDQYRAAVLDAPGSTTPEYLMWAANSGKLCVREDPAWWTTAGTGTIQPPWTVTVRDDSSSDIWQIQAVTLARGGVTYSDQGWVDPEDVSLGRAGSAPYPVVIPSVEDRHSVTLTDSNLYVGTTQTLREVLFPNGLDLSRGDEVIEVRYVLAEQRFHWTRNDRYANRFGWHAGDQRWAPWNGTTTIRVGVVEVGGTYQLNPKLRVFSLGTILEGSLDHPELFSTLRVGSTPAEGGSTPLGPGSGYTGVLVVDDVENHVFTDEVAVVGQLDSRLKLNPLFESEHVGVPLWYYPSSFQEDMDGVLGSLRDGEWFLAPVPTEFEYPQITIGNRAHLTAYAVDTEADLLDPLEGECLYSRSTGKLRLSSVDQAKASPLSPHFDPQFLTAQVHYRGVRLNDVGQTVEGAQSLVQVDGLTTTLDRSSLLYLRDSDPLLQMSGVVSTPDSTGSLPLPEGADPTQVRASAREGGDTLAPPGGGAGPTSYGLVRQVSTDAAESLLYTRRGVLGAPVVVRTGAEVPALPLKLRAGQVYVALEPVALGTSVEGSPVQISAQDRKTYLGETVWFRRCAMRPARHTRLARLVSRQGVNFRFSGSEVLRFAVDGTPVTWSASSLPVQVVYTAEQVAQSLQDALDVAGATGVARVSSGHLVLESATPSTGSVSIGWGPNGDLSGCAVLGFLPGWWAEGGRDNWLNDSGFAFGLAPSNVEGPDYRSTVSFDGVLGEVSETPLVFLPAIPREDLPGYAPAQYFRLRSVSEGIDGTEYTERVLQPYQDVHYDFEQQRLLWLSQQSQVETVTQPVTGLSLRDSILPVSLEYPGSVSLAETGGAFEVQSYGADYSLLGDGSLGQILLKESVNREVLHGYQGSWTVNTFTDFSSDFSSVQAGYSLRVGENLYTILERLTTTSLRLQHTVTESLDSLEWRVYEGRLESEYDPSVVADVQYVPFEHVSTEVVQLTVYRPLGSVTQQTNAPWVSSRGVSLRVSESVEDTLQVHTLSQTVLGTLANGLNVGSSPHVTAGAFLIRVGLADFTPVPVAVFSPDPVGVEYLTSGGSAGELKFGSSVLAAYAGSEVSLVEVLRSNPPEGVADWSLTTGDLRLSSEDVVTFAGGRLYFCSRLTLGGDYSLDPQSGVISLRSVVSPEDLLQIGCWAADATGRRSGDPLRAFLTTTVEDTPVRISATEFWADSSGTHRLDWSRDPVVYLGPVQQNFGTRDFTVDAHPSGVGMRISFLSAVDVIPRVVLSVLDTQGSRTFRTPVRPVYWPPFFIQSGRNLFGLRGDRTSNLYSGQMLRLGSDALYIKAVQYYADSDLTTVSIYPSTVWEVGSRSQGSLQLITDRAVSENVDGTPTEALGGFWFDLDLSSFPFTPVQKGQSEVIFKGDLSAFVVAGHVLELRGCPYLIQSGSFDGQHTVVRLLSSLREPLSVSSVSRARFSVRPIYPTQTQTFLGVGSPLDTDPILLARWSDGVGTLLQRNQDWSISPSGRIDLAQGLGTGEKLLLHFSRRRELSPLLQEGTLVYPRWSATWLAPSTPSASNGLLGAVLEGRFEYASPDTYYVRIPTLRSFLSESIAEAVNDLRSANGGPALAVSLPQSNWDRGVEGLSAQRGHLQDKDRSARRLLLHYNQGIVAFEQIQENISGDLVGDRSGKFRFDFTSEVYTRPGNESPFTGELNPRNLWAEICNQQDPSRDIRFLSSDPLVIPVSCSLQGLVLSGNPLGASQLRGLQEDQARQVRNDVDDVVLVAGSKPRVVRTTTPPYYRAEQVGVFQSLWQPGEFSRLFPTSARVFFTLLPGIGSEEGGAGTYSWGTENPITGREESTNRKSIGTVGNPVLGDITGISEKILQPRVPRSRVLRFCPAGIPSTVFGAAVETPCFVSSVVPLSVLQINPLTGYPDPSQFVSEGGTLPDLNSGDPDMAVPGYVPGQRLALGTPQGDFYPLAYPEEIQLLGRHTYTGVYVDQVLFGCVLTLRNRHGEVLTDPEQILVGRESAKSFGISEGDTLYVSPSGETNPLPDGADSSPTMADLQTAANTLPTYRVGFDVGVRTTGQVVDLSYPSWQDPFLFPVQELLGQKPPVPMSHLEGEVDFTSSRVSPVISPALEGRPYDDAGDQRIPFVHGRVTESAILSEVSPAMGDLLGGGISTANYPDEILLESGMVPADALPFVGGGVAAPAVLTVQGDVFPSPQYGVLPATAGDLFHIQVEVGDPQPWQGLFEAARLDTFVDAGTTYSTLELPRFVTQVNEGSIVRHTLTNAVVHTTPGVYPANPQIANPPGIRLFEDLVNGNSVISLQDIPVVLNDEVTPGAGNLNSFLASSVGNVVWVRLHSRPDVDVLNGPVGPVTLGDSQDGRVLVEIGLRSGLWGVRTYQDIAMGTPVVWQAHSGVEFGVFSALNPGGETYPASVAEMRHIVIYGSVGVLPFAPTAGGSTEWFVPNNHMDPGGPFDRIAALYGWEGSVSLDSRLGSSLTASILSDRLTFLEAVDLRLSRPRTFVLDNGSGPVPLGTELRVYGCELGSGSVSTANDLGVCTFLSLVGSLVFAGGTWDGFRGGLSVPSWDRGGSVVTSNPNRISVMPTSSTFEGQPLLSGRGVAEENSVRALADLLGEGVQAGDILKVSSSSNPLALGTEKSGTYLVRHVVGSAPALDYLEDTRSAYVGTGHGVITSEFPRLESLSLSEAALSTVEGLPSAGRLFIPLDLRKLSSTDPAVFARALVSVDWTGVSATPVPKLLLGTLPTWRWADDTLVSDWSEVLGISGVQVSWHDTPVAGSGPQSAGKSYLSVSMSGGKFPQTSSLVGHTSVESVLGVHSLAWTGSGSLSHSVADFVLSAPLPGQVQVLESAVETSEVILPESAVVYPGVWSGIILCLDDAQSQALNDPNGHLTPGNFGVACILPGTRVEVVYRAEGGIYLEPSLPVGPPSLSFGPNLVSMSWSRPVGTVGMRSPSTPEGVLFSVRRGRRWQPAQTELGSLLARTPYVYEIRRGIVTGFVRTDPQSGLVQAESYQMAWDQDHPGSTTSCVWNDGGVYSGTNLGPFTDPLVNVHPGDVLRILSDSGEVLDTGEIREVINASTLRIAPPGLSRVLSADMVGLRFEIYLRQAPVPHEQSLEQLLEWSTDTVVLSREADRTALDPLEWTGGFVPSTDGLSPWSEVSNRLQDDSGIDFRVAGVRVGDYVVIDPVGTILSLGETGSAPLGDTGVEERSEFSPGRVSSLDDNRGFYRVSEVDADELRVASDSDLLQTRGASGLEYSGLPTVHLSALSPDGVEGAGDLRPTEFPVGGSYSSLSPVQDEHSIRPFSYRVIRPTTMLSREGFESILFMRERVLSTIELWRRATQDRSGSYLTWQQEDHAEDLGDVLDPFSGVGWYRNEVLLSVLGDWSNSPYLNSSLCLSLLDRRVWIGDTRLERLEPDPQNPYRPRSATSLFPNVGGPYLALSSAHGSTVRPLISDLAEEVLETRDQLRELRQTWLVYRTHQTQGTLVQLRAFDARLAERVFEQERLQKLQATAGRVP